MKLKYETNFSIRLSWIVYMILAVLTLGVAWYIDDLRDQKAETRAAELAAGPPPINDLSNFGPDSFTSGGEILVRAQIYEDAMYELEIEDQNGNSRKYILMFAYSVAATESDIPIAPAAILFRASPSTNAALDRFYNVFVNGDAGFGPIVEVNGEKGSYNSDLHDLVLKSAADEGITFDGVDYMISPFFNGRNVDYAQDEDDIVLLVGFLVAGIFLFMCVVEVIANRQRQKSNVI